MFVVSVRRERGEGFLRRIEMKLFLSVRIYTSKFRIMAFRIWKEKG